MKAGDLEVSLGDIVAITPHDEDNADEAHAQICMIQALWQTPKAKMMQVMDHPHRVAEAFVFGLPCTHHKWWMNQSAALLSYNPCAKNISWRVATDIVESPASAHIERAERIDWSLFISSEPCHLMLCTGAPLCKGSRDSSQRCSKPGRALCNRRL